MHLIGGALYLVALGDVGHYGGSNWLGNPIPVGGMETSIFRIVLAYDPLTGATISGALTNFGRFFSTTQVCASLTCANDTTIFIYGSAGYIGAWDTTQAYSTRRQTQATGLRTGYNFSSIALTYMKASKNFLIFNMWSANYITSATRGLFLLNLNTHPISTWDNTVNPTSIYSVPMAEASTMYLDTTNEKFFFLDSGGDGFFHVKGGFLSVAGSTPTNFGSTGLPFISASNIPKGFCEIGNYCFILMPDANAWIYNTITQATAFNIGSGTLPLNSTIYANNVSNTNVYPATNPWSESLNILPHNYLYKSRLYPMFLMVPHLAPTNSFGVTIPSENRTLIEGFFFNGVNQFATTASQTFKLENKPNNFVVNMNLTDGNPQANRVRITVQPNRVDAVNSTLYTLPADFKLSFPSNDVTTIAIPLTTSVRGPFSSIQAANINANPSPFYRRYATINGYPLRDDPNASYSTNVSINGIIYPFKFFAYSDVGYLTCNATGKKGFTISSLTVTGRAINSASSTLAADKKDAGSIALYNREFPFELSTPLFNDPSLYQDLLLNGKYSKIYAESVDLPWYPVIQLGSTASLSNENYGLSGGLFEIIEYTIEGFTTTFKAKQYFQTFNI